MAASCFVVAENVIEELKNFSENLNTRKSTNLLVGVFKKLAGRAALRNIGEKAKTWRHTRFKLRINFALYD
jgi:tRNA-dihydrouridine synthase